jgi:pimeloyl-ACP methyl ester carboxylesterase
MDVEQTGRKAITHSLMAVLVILVLVTAGAAAYYLIAPGVPSHPTTTSSSTPSSTTTSGTSVVVHNLTTTLNGLTLAVFYPPGKNLPLVIYSMGYCTGCPSNFGFYFDFVKDIASSGYVVAYLNQSLGAVGPPIDQFVFSEVANITAVINYMNKTYPVGNVDLSRIVLVGHSAGGAATLVYISEKPATIRCAVALAPWSDSNLTRPATTPPFLVVAGQLDDHVPPWMAHEWIANLTASSEEYVIIRATHNFFFAYRGSSGYNSLLNLTVSFLSAQISSTP